MKTHTIKLVAVFAIILAIFNSYAYSPDTNNKLSAKERSEGWKLLFDGQSTSGWHLYNSQAPFTVWKAKDGELFCDPQDKSGAGDLVTDNEYKNFDLKFEWKLPSGGNSGVFVNVLERQDIPTGWASGPEYQLLDNDNKDFANPKQRSGCLFNFTAQKTPVKIKPAGGWNHSEIKQMNGKVRFYLNGVLTTEEDFTSKAWADAVAASHFHSFPEFGKHISGHLVLQDWATGIAFRNIKIKQL